MSTNLQARQFIWLLTKFPDVASQSWCYCSVTQIYILYSIWNMTDRYSVVLILYVLIYKAAYCTPVTVQIQQTWRREGATIVWLLALLSQLFILVLTVFQQIKNISLLANFHRIFKLFVRSRSGTMKWDPILVPRTCFSGILKPYNMYIYYVSVLYCRGPNTCWIWFSTVSVQTFPVVKAWTSSLHKIIQ